MSLSPDFGFGVGFYTSAGAHANYKHIDAGSNKDLSENTELGVAEASIGLGYRVNDRLKLGAAYRVSMAKAEFTTVVKHPSPLAPPGTLINLGVKDLTATDYQGFKAGAQMKFGEKTLVGVTYRSPVFFEADGSFSGTGFDGVKAKAKTVLPEAVTAGVSSELWDHWNIMGEYAWTQYSRVKDIGVDGDLKFTQHVAIQQNWKDQHNVRVAGEFTGYEWPIRFGYGWTSQVTASEWARGTFAPPAALHTLSVGTGQWLGSGLKLDGGFNYTFGGADNNHNDAAGLAYLRDGTFSVEEYAVNLELMYAF